MKISGFAKRIQKTVDVARDDVRVSYRGSQIIADLYIQKIQQQIELPALADLLADVVKSGHSKAWKSVPDRCLPSITMNAAIIPQSPMVTSSLLPEFGF